MRPAGRFSKKYSHHAVRLRTDDTERPTKGGVFDDSILLDSKDRVELGPALAALAAGRGKKEKLFSFTPSQFRARWLKAMRGMQSPENYCIHHS